MVIAVLQNRFGNCYAHGIRQGMRCFSDELAVPGSTSMPYTILLSRVTCAKREAAVHLRFIEQPHIHKGLPVFQGVWNVLVNGRLTSR